MADPKELDDELENDDSKEKKKKDKKEKKEKDSKENEELEEQEETVGSKILLFFVTIIIILIWLGIIAILIKTDVGGFGSSVLTPILKDVPYVNKILPNSTENGTEGTEYSYNSLDEAIEQIKLLEKELDEARNSGDANSEYIAELEAQIEELNKYKEEQAAFEETKEKFYEEVVFSDNAPDIEEYKTYYESIDSENAEVLYKQVVQQLAYDSEIEDYAATYSSMKAKEAAEIFDAMTDDLDLVASILEAMDTQSRADVLGQMDADTAAKVTKIMNPES